MQIKAFISLIAVSIATVASADLLLWQVDSPVVDETTHSNIEYAYAQIMGSSANSYTGEALSSKVGDYNGTVTKVDSGIFDVATVGAIIGDNKNYTANYIYIELFDSTGASVGRSGISQVESLSSYITSASQFGASFSGVNKWGGVGTTTYTAVPEPTSGLLMLLGAAMLGLRRRKVA